MKIVLLDHKAISWNKLYVQTHWSERQAMAKGIHNFVAATTYQIRKRKITGLVDVFITAYYTDKRHRDSDNIAAKLYIDGLRDILEGDDTRYIRLIGLQTKIGQKENRVEIEIKRIKSNLNQPLVV